MRQIAEFIAVLSCALFTGAAVYITFIEHPARMQCGVEIAATEFAPSYRRATVMQATCAALGLLASVGAWLAGATFPWLVGGVLLGSVIPFTLIAILPTNKRLLSPTLDRRSAEAERLLARWGRLHAVRSVLSGLGLLLFLYLLLREGYCAKIFSGKSMNPPFRAKQEVIINAPLETVWEFGMDITRIPEFHPRVVKVELISGKARREPGVSYRCHLSGGKHTCVEKMDFEGLVMYVRRAYVWGRFKEPKSKASKAPVPMHPLLAGFMLAWRAVRFQRLHQANAIRSQTDDSTKAT